MKIAIIGGGASGMMAAISAAKSGAEVVICERFDRLGKKILATGNGRCNLSNTNACKENYHGRDVAFIEYATEHFWVNNTLDFFEKLGLLYKIESDGKVYPYSNVAASVLDILRFELERLNVEIEYNFEVKCVKKQKEGFFAESYAGKRIYADKVIVASGGKASPSLGSNGSGYALLQNFGHKLTALNPSLVQVKLKNNPFKAMNGLKLNASVFAKNSKNTTTSQTGEILFTDYGVSGPLIFGISGLVGKVPESKMHLDFMPEYSVDEVYEILKKHSAVMTLVDELFCGIFAKRIGQVIIKNSVECKLNEEIGVLSDNDLKKISEKVKDFTVECDGTTSWNNAQVTAGGIDVSDFDSATMESKLVKGLYATGEILDIDGDCGGYNLQWAWSSGYIAGKSAAEQR